MKHLKLYENKNENLIQRYQNIYKKVNNKEMNVYFNRGWFTIGDEKYATKVRASELESMILRLEDRFNNPTKEVKQHLNKKDINKLMQRIDEEIRIFERCSSDNCIIMFDIIQNILKQQGDLPISEKGLEKFLELYKNK